MADPADTTLPEKVTFDFNDGDMVVTVEVADGAIGGGWGITRVEVTSRTPIRPESLKGFLDAVSQVILTGGIQDLIKQHDTVCLVEYGDGAVEATKG
jgi:hypothetical protein